MKANRKFVEGEEAVSEVIGVFLMLAIAVAIAATLYVYVSGMIGVQQKVPSIQMLADEDDDKLSVININAGVYWDSLAIRSTGDVNISINSEVTTSVGVTLSADTYYQVNDSMMESGNAHVFIQGADFIDIEGTLADLDDITITIIHDDSGTIRGTYTYSSIAVTAD